MREVQLSHPLEAYFIDKKSGAVTDEQAKDSIAGLVNDAGLLQEACAIFTSEINGGDRCYAVGKVYDVEDERYGCVTILSEDVANVIGNDFLSKTHEEINYHLVCAYLEYRRFCREVNAVYDAWDDYMDFIIQKNFVSLFKNGVRARLIHTDAVDRSTLPTIVFIVYQKYSEL